MRCRPVHRHPAAWERRATGARGEPAPDRRASVRWPRPPAGAPAWSGRGASGPNPIDTRPGPTPLTEVPRRGAITSTATTTNGQPTEPPRPRTDARRLELCVLGHAPTLGARSPRPPGGSDARVRRSLHGSVGRTRIPPFRGSDDGNRSRSALRIAESLEIGWSGPRYSTDDVDPRRVPMSPTQIDAIDEEIIRQLQTDGRRPYTQLAKVVGLSEAAVRQRVQRLLETGVMQVVAVTDPLSLGLRRQAMVGIKVEGDVRQVADELGRARRGRLRRADRRLGRPPGRGRRRERRRPAATSSTTASAASPAWSRPTRRSTSRLRKQTYQWGTR